MEERRASLELALLAKEKGFEEECKFVYRQDDQPYEIPYWEDTITNDEIEKEYKGFYTENNYVCTCPTLAFLQKWLREKHLIHVDSTLSNPMDRKLGFKMSITVENPDGECNFIAGYGGTMDYDLSLEEGLLLALRMEVKI